MLVLGGTGSALVGLEQALAVDRGLFADLQSSLTVLAPLIASAAAVFLPK